ncbi:MAG: 3'-5' exonuclease [Clostridia bacterium]|nr:3'-5' exonuclease [Clostridia bacterium]
MKDKVFVVLDLETTGCRASDSGPADSIIEIGACKIVEGNIVETFSSLINPERPIPGSITNLTGISNRMVLFSPTYEKVMPDFYKFCFGACLVGHNLKRFDIRFLRRYWAELGFSENFDMIDTIDLAHKVLPGLENYKLPTVGRRLGYTFGGDNSHHRALNDTLITAKIFLDLEKGADI